MLPFKLKTLIKDRIFSNYLSQIEECATLIEMVQPTIIVIRFLAQEVLTDHYLYLS
jgi:hypothetical protein